MRQFVTFVFSPIFSLFSPSFYKSLPKRSVGEGFLYLFYLAVWGAFVLMLMISLRWLPAVDEFVDWFSYQTPTFTFNEGRITTNVKEPYAVTHPTLGTLLIVNTKKKEIKPEDLQNVYFYVTSHVIYASDPIRNETRMFDLGAQAHRTGNQLHGPQSLDGQMIRQIYQTIKPLVSVIFFFVIVFLVFVWKMTAALLYSVAALLLNRFREEKFSYATLLNFSCFSLTAVFILQLANIVFFNLQMPVPLWLSFAVTVFYLIFGILFVLPPERTRTIP